MSLKHTHQISSREETISEVHGQRREAPAGCVSGSAGPGVRISDVVPSAAATAGRGTALWGPRLCAVKNVQGSSTDHVRGLLLGCSFGVVQRRTQREKRVAEHLPSNRVTGSFSRLSELGSIFPILHVRKPRPREAEIIV